MASGCAIARVAELECFRMVRFARDDILVALARSYGVKRFILASLVKLHFTEDVQKSTAPIDVKG